MANHLAKQSRPGRSLKEFFSPSLPDNPTLCSVSTLQEYILRTKQFREGKDDDHKDRLFITTTEGHSPVASATIARWIKSALTKAGIDTSIFKAHSVRGATTTAAGLAGISISEIRKQRIGHHNQFLKGSIIDLTHRCLVRWYYLWLLTSKVEM